MAKPWGPTGMGPGCGPRARGLPKASRTVDRDAWRIRICAGGLPRSRAGVAPDCISVVLPFDRAPYGRGLVDRTAARPGDLHHRLEQLASRMRRRLAPGSIEAPAIMQRESSIVAEEIWRADCAVCPCYVLRRIEHIGNCSRRNLACRLRRMPLLRLASHRAHRETGSGTPPPPSSCSRMSPPDSRLDRST